MGHDFIICDVFTDKPFGGNQLAVFPQAEGISDHEMQAFAREINFAESTFVLPPRDPRCACRVRIFTPKTELPFAGHPTVGTAAVLAHLGKIPSGTASVVFEEGIGPVTVEIDLGKMPTSTRLMLENTTETAPIGPSHKAAAAALSLSEETILDAFCAGLGVRFSFIHLWDRDAVDRAALDRAAWAANFAQAWAPQLYCFSGNVTPNAELYVRMFAPSFGIEEDPATGSGAAILAGVLAGRLPEAEGRFAWHIRQGVALGRPSQIEASAEKRNGRPVKLMVGGSTVIIGRGAIDLSIGTS